MPKLDRNQSKLTVCRDLAPILGDLTVESDFRPLNSLSDECMETTNESSEEIETSSEEHQQELQVQCHLQQEEEVIEEETADDDELEIDIYRRRSPRENSTSCSSFEAFKTEEEEDHADHPEIKDLSEHQNNNENCDDDTLLSKSDIQSKKTSLLVERLLQVHRQEKVAM